MSKIRTLGVSTAVAVGLTFAGYLAHDARAADEEVVVPVATWGSPTHDNIVHFVGPLEESLYRQSGGRIGVKHYPAGQLAEDVDMPIAIPSGKVKFAWITIAGWSGTIPDVGIIDRPVGLTMPQAARAADMDGGLREVLDKRFREKGATLLAMTDLGPAAFVSNTKVVAPSDMKGLKVRVYSEGAAKLAQLMGAIPVKMAFAEVYTAMQRGTIDAAMMGFQGVASQRMNEVADYVLVPASFFGTGMQGWAANLEWWEGLEPSDQEMIGGAIREAELIARYELVRIRRGLADEYRGLGMEVTVLDSSMPEYSMWEQAVRPLWDDAKKSLSPEIVAPIEKLKAESASN